MISLLFMSIWFYLLIKSKNSILITGFIAGIMLEIFGVWIGQYKYCSGGVPLFFLGSGWALLFYSAEKLSKNSFVQHRYAQVVLIVIMVILNIFFGTFNGSFQLIVTYIALAPVILKRLPECLLMGLFAMNVDIAGITFNVWQFYTGSGIEPKHNLFTSSFSYIFMYLAVSYITAILHGKDYSKKDIALMIITLLINSIFRIYVYVI